MSFRKNSTHHEHDREPLSLNGSPNRHSRPSVRNAAVGWPSHGVQRTAFALIQRRIDPLYRRLDLAPVVSASGAFQYLAHVQQGADQRWNGRGR